jgi:cell division protein ZapA
MKYTQAGINVSIFGKEFMVACPENEREDLMRAAKYLDGKMAEIHQSGKVLGAERCAIMAALNIAHELLRAQQNGNFSPEFSERIRALNNKIGSALDGSAQNSL